MIRDFFNRVVNPYYNRGLDVWIQDQPSELVDLCSSKIAWGHSR